MIDAKISIFCCFVTINTVFVDITDIPSLLMRVVTT